MSLFAIADTHLSFGTDKPMDQFYGWQGYVGRLKENWNHTVQEEDTVVIAGDISWAMNFSQLAPDLDFLNGLPGKKIILKGNHDYWWNTKTKMDSFLREQGFSTLEILHNSAVRVGPVTVCGSRGWFFDAENAQDQKVLQREVGRLARSLEAGKALGGERIVFLHYPPVTAGQSCEEILELLGKEGIRRCYYGHLHGSAARNRVEKQVQSIDFSLISADYLQFCPLLIERF